VVASVDILPTLAYLAGGKLPDREIDGHNIWPLMHGEVGAKSPHAAWCLMHGPGTVRSGKWKYYPWQEGKHHQDRPQKQENLSEHPVQLYNTRADIGETTNVAAEHPEIVQRLQAAYEAQVADIEQKRRPTAKLLRPPGSLSPARPKRNQ
jgi:arylsulfatase A